MQHTKTFFYYDPTVPTVVFSQGLSRKVQPLSRFNRDKEKTKWQPKS
jgi:hypothetical protein